MSPRKVKRTDADRLQDSGALSLNKGLFTDTKKGSINSKYPETPMLDKSCETPITKGSNKNKLKRMSTAKKSKIGQLRTHNTLSQLMKT